MVSKKTLITFILCIALLLGSVNFSWISQAAETTNAYYNDISSYRQNGTYPTKEGYVFAGWYHDTSFTKESALGENEVADGAYAKFVDEKVLSVKFQLKMTETSTGKMADLRMLTSVDALNYQTVGFHVRTDTKDADCMSTVVYETVYGYVDSNKTSYQPSVFSPSSEYFMVHTLTGIPETDFEIEIIITPKWKTIDGTWVTGVARSITVDEASAYDTTLTDTEFGTIWSAPSTVKINQNETVYDTYSYAGDARLDFQAVRNEYESRQLLITATKDVSHFELRPSDLRMGDEVLDSENVTVYVQKYFPYKDSTQQGAEISYVPDALLPMDAADEYEINTITTGMNGAFWVTIYIPVDTATGIYTGSFQLIIQSDTEQQIEQIPVSLQVYDYNLPDASTAPTIFSWRYDRVAAGELDNSIEMMTQYYDYFQDYRISLQSMPLETLTGEEYLATVNEYYDRMSAYCILSYVGDVGSLYLGRSGKIIEQILTLASASTAERNLFEKAYIYYIDEPDFRKENGRNSTIASIDDLDKVLQMCVDEITNDKTGTYEEFKKINGWQDVIREIPNVIPLYQASFSWLLKGNFNWSSLKMVYNYETDEGKALLSRLNSVCFDFQIYESNEYQKLIDLCKEYGIKMWWYGCVGPDNPAPSYHISDANLLSARTVSWLQKKYDIEGNLYWDASAYTTESADSLGQYIDVYEFPYRKGSSFPAGDGVLTYPGAPYGVYGPVTSLRMMSIRDGMEEYELLQDLESKYSDSEMDNLFYSKISKNMYTDVMYSVKNGEVDFEMVRKTLLQNVAGITTSGTYQGSTRADAPFFTVSASECVNAASMKPAADSDNTELLFSFESYKDITGTEPMFGGQTGATRINTTKAFITDGNGSWMIRPQGDYAEKNSYPYFRLDCIDTTFKKSNFAGYDKLLLDVYNASDKTVTMQLTFQVMNVYGEEVPTDAIQFVLKPHAWTTCEYALDGEQYNNYFILDSVEYMTVTFLTKKQSKDDDVAELYMDNLRGVLSDTERVRTEFTYSFENGVTFEQPSELYLFEGGTNEGMGKMPLTRVDYKDTNVKLPYAAFGKYALKGDATGSTYPEFFLEFGQTYPAGTVLNFNMYVEVDDIAASGKTYRMESYHYYKQAVADGATIVNPSYKYNEWITVSIQLNQNTDNLWTFLNFSKQGKITGPVTVYFDNFRVNDTVKNDVGLSNGGDQSSGDATSWNGF